MRLKRRRWSYSWDLLLGDATGGLIAALIALPYGLALASLMRLPPILGVYTSIISAPLLTLLGRNPVLIGGASAVTAPFIAVAFERQGLGGAAKVSLVAAIFMMSFCVLRLGRHITKLPLPVISGFSCGIGALMILSQLQTLFGVEVARDGPIILQAFRVAKRLAAASPAALTVGTVTLAAAVVSKRWLPHAPAPLAGLILGTATAALFGENDLRLGELPVEWPPFVGFSWAPRDVFEVLPEGFALAVVTSVNLLVTSRVLEHFRGARSRLKRTEADGELGAYSIANLVTGMFGAPMSVGIPARSLANIRCGGRTRISNLMHGLWLGAFLFLGQDWIEMIPRPALAGVTIWMGVALLNWSAWKRIRLMRREEAGAFILTAFATLLVNAVAAVASGFALHTLVIYLRKQAEQRETPALEPFRQRPW